MEYWIRLDALPEDILVEIFCFLPCRSLAQVALVSRTLIKVTQNRSATLWRNLCFTTFGITFKDDKERLYDFNLSKEEGTGTQEEESSKLTTSLSWSNQRRRKKKKVTWKSVFKSLSGKHRISSLPEKYANFTGCTHYKRNCQIFTKCCNEIFPCHICHDHECGAGEVGEKVVSGGERGAMDEDQGGSALYTPIPCENESCRRDRCDQATCSSGCSHRVGASTIASFSFYGLGTGLSVRDADVCAADCVGASHSGDLAGGSSLGRACGVGLNAGVAGSGRRRTLVGSNAYGVGEMITENLSDSIFEQGRPHMVDRFAVDTMLCMKCGCMQAIGKTCCNCKAEMASYYCEHCRLWNDGEEGHIYHCDKCGICRKGKGLGVDNWHCDNCGICFSLSVKPLHECQIKNGLRVTCPLCPSSQLLFYSREVVTVLPCGHAAHMQCIQKRLEDIDEGELICFTCEQQRQAFLEDDEEQKEEEKKTEIRSADEKKVAAQQPTRAPPDVATKLPPPPQGNLSPRPIQPIQQQEQELHIQALQQPHIAPPPYVENIQQFYSNYVRPQDSVVPAPFPLFQNESLYKPYSNYHQDSLTAHRDNQLAHHSSNPNNYYNNTCNNQNHNIHNLNPSNSNNAHKNNSNNHNNNNTLRNIDNFNSTHSTTYSNSNSPIGSRNWSGNYNKKMVTSSRPVRIDRQQAQRRYHCSSSSSASCSPPSSPKIFTYPGDNLSLASIATSPQAVTRIGPRSSDQKVNTNLKTGYLSEQTTKLVCVQSTCQQEPNVFELPDHYYLGGPKQTSFEPGTLLDNASSSSGWDEWKRGSRVCCFGGM